MIRHIRALSGRHRTLGVLILVLWSVLWVRAGWLQLHPNDQMKSYAKKQFQSTVSLNARRGAIVDRQGRDLALSETAHSLFVDPQQLKTPRRTARWLAKELGLSADILIEKFRDTERRFVWVARTLDEETYKKIQKQKVAGIGWVEEARRIYPNEKLLGPVLGFLGSEGQGLEGLEKAYDELLSSKQKRVEVRRDARGRPLILDGQMFEESLEGLELQLTVDLDLQHQLESELQKAQTDFDADQAIGIILDAKTSAILAVGVTPGFDPNQGSKSPANSRRNRPVTDLFEPGSTLKTFALAGALREGLITPNKKYATEQGRFKVGNRLIREAEASHNWQELTVSEILALSSNIGTTKIAFELGAEKMRQTLLDFGFASKSGVDLPGEAKGVLVDLPWSQHLLSNISFGQGMMVSPLQLANAYATIANGGTLNEPFIVLAEKDLSTGKVEINRPKAKRRVLTPEQASQMKMMLVGVTAPGGTGVNARVPGFLVAGKTGTAQKADPNARGYMPNAYISSFVGFLPAENPEYVILVAVDHPKQRSYYGSQVAAPLFSRLASYAVRKQGLAPVLLSEAGNSNDR